MGEATFCKKRFMGEVAGYLAAYLVFTTVLFVVLFHSGMRVGSYLHVGLITLLIVGMGHVARKVVG